MMQPGKPMHCQGVSRRHALKLGLGGLFGLSLVESLRAAGKGQRRATAKSCILIWMDGGPTHYETFDPKPEAPVEVRGSYSTISTKIPGVAFSQHMTKLASLADKLTVIRSIRHNQGNHGAGNHYMMTGAPPRIPVGCGAFVSFHPSMGSMTAHELTAPAGLPGYFSLPSMTRSGGPNFLGGKYGPFVVGGDPNSAGFRVRDVALPQGLLEPRFNSRRALRKSVDQLVRLHDATAGDPVLELDEFYQQGREIITSPAAQRAFDIHREPENVREHYGRNAFGQRALLARRLVQAGVPFITLNQGGWDHHGDIFNALNTKLPPFEHTIGALLEDLDRLGLLETTLVLALGEFGRTPKVNSRGGRDHWSNAMSVMMAGGGTPRGLVLGATDRQGYTAVERVLSPENFVSTVYAKLGIEPNKILFTPEGRPARLVTDPTPIAELMS